MTNLYKILAQVAPTANTDTDLLVVATGKQVVCSTVALCNRSSSVVLKYRIAVVPDGETLANEHYIIYDEFIDGRSSCRYTIGMTLNEGDKIIVRSDQSNLSCTVFGNEITP